MGRTEELRKTAFRKVLKSCTEPKPRVEDDLVEAIEKLSVSSEALRAESSDEASARGDEVPKFKYEGAHFFSEMEYSPGKSSYSKNDFCPCEMSSEELCRNGQREVHIPYLNFTSNTYLRLVEITEHATHVSNLKKRINELETKLERSEAENDYLRAENKSLGEGLEAEQ